MLYARDEGVAQDDKQAAFWFRKAADQGEAMAQFNLGLSISTEQADRRTMLKPICGQASPQHKN